jgi:hypothetical protein
VKLQNDLQRVADVCRLLQRAISELHDKVPETPEERRLDDLGVTPELATRVRAQLLCILTDAIEPAGRDLERLADECRD